MCFEDSFRITCIRHTTMPLLPEFEDRLQRFLNNQLDKEEFDSFFQELSEVDDNDLSVYLTEWGLKEEFSLAKSAETQVMWDAKLAKLWKGLPHPAETTEATATIPLIRSKRWLALSGIAAGLLCVLAVSVYLWKGQSQEEQRSASTTYPSENISQITLPSGEVISIQDSISGSLYKNDELEIVRIDNGELQFVYKNHDLATLNNQFNSIHTSKGGFTKFQLEDGTKVHLNSESTLRFPLTFAKDKREVFLDGEGYFEVVKNKEAPFLVHTAKQDIEVLGTTFNVKSYADEMQETTTLVEGLVKVTGVDEPLVDKVILHPDQQATIQEKNIRVQQVSPEEYTGWVSKRFIFSGTPLEVVLRDIERWYDIKFAYEGKLPAIRIEGNLSKDVALDKLLKVLSINTTYNFSMKGRRVYMEK